MSVRKTVLVVAVLNLLYFFVEFSYGRIYGSVSLLSDSIDFLEDASVNFLILLAIGWSLSSRKLISYLFAGLLLIPGISFLWNAIQKVLDPTTPHGEGMTIVGLGALVVNVFCAIFIAKHKSHEHSLILAAFYSARNDAIANIMIIASGLITLLIPSIWPDLLVGLIIFGLNADAARKVIQVS